MKLQRYLFFSGLVFLACTVLTGPHSGRSYAAASNATNATAALHTQDTQQSETAASCRSCHAPYYAAWDHSPHGTCFTPVTPDFVTKKLTLPKQPVTMGKETYAVEFTNNRLQMLESGPDGEKRYEALYALGGRHVYFFLTRQEKGRLQLMPLAYDPGHKEWFDTRQSGVPHVPGRRPGSDPQLWKNRAFAFSTSCYNCHVNSYNQAYDLEHDTYPPFGAVSGLACASCHGPGDAHVAAHGNDSKPHDKSASNIIRGGNAFNTGQINDNCAACHALALPLTQGFKPGEAFSDNFSLITLDHPAYYPDGRAKRETFVFGQWQLSPCALSGKLDCLHCHTPGGNFRFADSPNQACAPCHAALVADPAPHTHHPADSEAGKCVSCHMPQQPLDRIRHTDHSMLPPTPALSKAYGSPNACNGCHADKDADWADAQVRRWQPRDYQAPLLERAGLIEAARNRDWSRAPEMIGYISRPDRNAFFAASLLRLLAGYNNRDLWDTVLKSLKDPSPLVRAAAVHNLGQSSCPQAFPSLLHAIGDNSRMVRIQAAMELSQIPIKGFPIVIQAQLKGVMTEYVSSLIARPDQWNAHFRMGTLFAAQGDRKVARSAYKKALELEPHALPALINLALLQQMGGDLQHAEETIRKALKLDPQNIQALLNLGVILGRKGDVKASEQELRHVLHLAPNQPEAAFNLAVLLAKDKENDRMEEALQYAQQAYDARPSEAKYAFALAYYLNKAEQRDKAAAILEKSLQLRPEAPDMYLLLGQIQNDKGDTQAARETYEAGLRMKGATNKFKTILNKRLQKLGGEKNTADSPGQTSESDK